MRATSCLAWFEKNLALACRRNASQTYSKTKKKHEAQLRNHENDKKNVQNQQTQL